jgi:hypothetical protein
MQFSYKRLILIVSWLVFTTPILSTNSKIKPNYNHEFITILMALLCLTNTGYLLTNLLGINEIVTDFELRN